MTAIVGPRSVWKNLVGYYISNDTRSYPGSGTTWYDLSAKKNNMTASAVSYNSSELAVSGTSQFTTSAPIGDIIESNKFTVVVVARTSSTQPVDIFTLADTPYSVNYAELDPPPVDSFATKEPSTNNYNFTLSTVDMGANMTVSTGATKNVSANNYNFTTSTVDMGTNMTTSTGAAKNVSTNNYSFTLSTVDMGANMTTSTGSILGKVVADFSPNYSYDNVKYYKNGIYMTINSTVNRDIPNFVSFDLDLPQNRSNVDMPAKTADSQFYCIVYDKEQTSGTMYIDGYTNRENGRIDYNRNFYSGEQNSIIIFPNTALKFGGGASSSPTVFYRMIAVFDRALSRDEVQDMFAAIRGKYSL